MKIIFSLVFAASAVFTTAANAATMTHDVNPNLDPTVTGGSIALN